MNHRQTVFLFIGGPLDGQRNAVTTPCGTLEVPRLIDTPRLTASRVAIESYRRVDLRPAPQGREFVSVYVHASMNPGDAMGALIDHYKSPKGH